MYAGDRARKEVLVEYGFRLPSALDNRPLKADEYINKAPHYLFVSATPAEYELEMSSVTAKQIIRPTGLLDPVIEIRLRCFISLSNELFSASVSKQSNYLFFVLIEF